MIKMRIENNFVTGQVNLFIADVTGNHRSFAEPLQLVMHERSDYAPGEMSHVIPALAIDDAFAGEFFNELTRALLEAGYGPHPELDNAELEAIKRHLEDMRKLVFDRLKSYDYDPTKEKKDGLD